MARLDLGKVVGESATVDVGTTTTVEAGQNANVTNSGTTSNAIFDFEIPRGADGRDGTNGRDGNDGISPTATVTQTESGATISITDRNGTTTANIRNGVDGANGTNGADGFSPSASVTTTSTGATISITDKNGTTTSEITNGQNGQDGQRGPVGYHYTPSVDANGNLSWTNDGGLVNPETVNIKGPQGIAGTDGTDGDDGFSPVANVSQSGNDTTISITDKNGTTSATITTYDNKYRTTKQPVGTWIDGKTIYRVVIPTQITASGAIDIPSGINNIGFMTKFYGILYMNNTNGEIHILNHATTSGQQYSQTLFYYTTTNNFQFRQGQSVPTPFDLYIVFEYTESSAEQL